MYVGFDLSLTSSGYSSLDSVGNIIESGRIRPYSKKGMERIDYIKFKLDQVSKKAKLVTIEDYAYGVHNSSSLTGLAELNGVIRMSLYKKNIPYLLVTPGELKKFITGKGNCKKELMMMKIFKNYGLEFNNSDEADAYGLSLICSAVVTGQIATGVDYKDDILKKLRAQYKHGSRKKKKK